MLTYATLRNCGGITLLSDYLSLRALYDVVTDVNERSPLIRDKEGFLIGLAYDIRKAYEGRREVVKPDPLRPEVGPRYGVGILWPTLLVQTRQLRDALAFIDHSKSTQSAVYSLEAIVETALDSELGARAPEIKFQWERLDTHGPFVEENVETRIAQFAAWSKAERRNGLAGLLASLNSMYASFYSIWVSQGVEHLVAPEDFERWKTLEFPDSRC